MNETRIFIKNMVCPRCIRVVNEELVKAGYNVIEVTLGSALISDTPSDKTEIALLLKDNGFELLEEKSAKLVNDIKIFILQLIRNGKLEEEKHKISFRMEEFFKKEYSYLSHIFSDSENSTLEKYIISQKIELVKEWLVYDELTLSEMAWKLGYKNVAYLSTQFKQMTGFSPTEFKKLKDHKRKSLDSL